MDLMGQCKQPSRNCARNKQDKTPIRAGLERRNSRSEFERGSKEHSEINEFSKRRILKKHCTHLMHPDVRPMFSMHDLMIYECSLEELPEMQDALVEDFHIVGLELNAEKSTPFTFDEARYSSGAILLFPQFRNNWEARPCFSDPRVAQEHLSDLLLQLEVIPEKDSRSFPLALCFLPSVLCFLPSEQGLFESGQNLCGCV